MPVLSDRFYRLPLWRVNMSDKSIILVPVPFVESLLFVWETGEVEFLFIRLASIQVAQYEDKFIDFFRRTMTQLKTVWK
jgi:hypothetical protein